MFAARGPEPTAIAGLAPPRILTASVGLTPTPWVDIRADLETEAQARAWEAAWPTLHQRLSTNPIVRITGLGALLAHAELERVDAQIHVHETATETEAIRFLQLTTRLLRTAAVVRQ
jgi:hypothetical protein